CLTPIRETTQGNTPCISGYTTRKSPKPTTINTHRGRPARLEAFRSVAQGPDIPTAYPSSKYQSVTTCATISGHKFPLARNTIAAAPPHTNASTTFGSPPSQCAPAKITDDATTNPTPPNNPRENS